MSKFIRNLLSRQLGQKRMSDALHHKLGIREPLGLPKEAKFLDCGCGTRFLCFEAANDGFRTYGFTLTKNVSKNFLI